MKTTLCRYGLSSLFFSEINQLAYRSVAMLLVDILTPSIYTCHLSPSKINSLHFCEHSVELCQEYVWQINNETSYADTPPVSFPRRARFGLLLMQANADSTEQQRQAISRISRGCVYVQTAERATKLCRHDVNFRNLEVNLILSLYNGKSSAEFTAHIWYLDTPVLASPKKRDEHDFSGSLCEIRDMKRFN